MKNKGYSQKQIADKVKADPKTIRKYSAESSPPSSKISLHDWTTRQNPFDSVWPEVVGFLENSPQIQALTMFEYLQRTYPGVYQDGQKRSLERRFRNWRGTDGPAKEVYFGQNHTPGKLGASDFSHMTECEVTIAGVPFVHMIFHFVLTYSNWESVTVCLTESFEGLSEGLQNAMWELNGAPTSHRTDRLSAAVKNLKGTPSEFTERYEGLMKHYGMAPQKIQAGHGNENGDVEQSHFRYKTAVKQALMLRGSRDFSTEQDYKKFLQKIVDQRNLGRTKRFAEEVSVLKALPEKRLDTDKLFTPKVTRNSTITINSLIYSVHSRLIGERLKVKQSIDQLEVWLGTECVDLIPRMKGSNKHQINYRHVIDSLVRKPGAFEEYVYREEMFPTSLFRIAYDQLCEKSPSKASREYLKILYLAATESEHEVQQALSLLLKEGSDINEDSVIDKMTTPKADRFSFEVKIENVDLGHYDSLLSVVLEL